MPSIDYYFEKNVAEIVNAVKSGVIGYTDLEMLLQNEENNKNRTTVKRAIKKRLNEINKNSRASKRHELETMRLKQAVKSQEKSVDLVSRIVEIVKVSMADIPDVEIPVKHELDNDHKEEVALLLLSDLHIGKKTKTYGADVFRERLTKLQESMISVVSGMRSIRAINKLVIVMNGDFLDAESIYPSQAIDGIDATVIEQIFSIGVPALTSFLLFCANNFSEVKIYAVRGNHGRLNASKWSSSKNTNWDTVLYKSLEAVTINQKNIEWNIVVDDWKKTFKVFDYGFLTTHGDMIKSYYNLPFYGMTRQSQRWCNAFRNKIRLDYFLFSHFHSLSTGQRWNDLEIFVNGSFVTDDQFALEKLGVSSKAEQLLIGIHPTYGVSWRFRLNLS